MKKYILLGLFVYLFSLYSYAQNVQASGTEKETSHEIPPIVAPSTIPLMGHTFHFSHWEYVRNKGQGCTYAGFLEDSILQLNPTENCLDYRRVPHVEAVYFHNLQRRKHSESASYLYSKEEKLILGTDGHKDPYGYEVYIARLNKTDLQKHPIQTCKENSDPVSYHIYNYDIPVILVSRGTAWGYISYSIPVNEIKITKKNKKDSTNVETNASNLEQAVQRIINAVCQFEYPQWLKDVPTIEEIKNQKSNTSNLENPSPVKKGTVKKHAPNSPSKTVIPKLQMVQPSHRSDK